MQKTLTFESVVSVFLTYLLLKVAPLTALAFYFYNWEAAILTGIVILLVILPYAAFSNHHFKLTDKNLQVIPSLFPWKKEQFLSLETIKSIEVKYSHGKNFRQWLLVSFKDGSKQKFRCDWLHMQDPPEEDDDHDHQHPDNELFEILDNEDFYEGSLEQLAQELRNRSVNVQETF